MAVKATAQITLSSVIDVKATYRYYLLQSSTLAKPAKPSTFPPASTWGDVEPNYVDGSTNTLYFVDCTVFCDDTFNYSAVSVSSAYEAAKIAYNKALSAQNGVTTLTKRVVDAETAIEKNEEQIELRATKTEVEKTYAQTASRGQQLVTNGNGLLGDNTNFSDLKFDGSASNNSPGSFTNKDGYESSFQLIRSNEFIPVDANKRYTLSFDAKTKNGLATMYSMLICYDIDGNEITAGSHSFVQGTLTTLTQDLTAGDTVVHLTDVSTWQRVYAAYRLVFWNYKNSHGYTYPAETYTRNMAAMPNTGLIPNEGVIDYVNNTVTLSTPWTGNTIPAGTQVSQGLDGSSYTYIATVNTVISKDWKNYEGSIQGVDYSGNNNKTQFPPAVAYCKVGFLWNYNKANDQIWVTNITLKDTTAENELSNRLTDAETQILQNAQGITLRATKTEVTEAVKSIEIGGSNLLRDSKGEFVSSTDSFYGHFDLAKETYTHGIVLTAGQTYTLSFDWAVDWSDVTPVTQVRVSVGCGATAGVYAYDIANADSMTSRGETSGRVIFTFTPTETQLSGRPYFSMRPIRTNTPDALDGSTWTIKNLKLETGNKATDWTPAPEDVANDINEVDAVAKDVNTRLSEAESTIKILADAIANIVRKNGDSSVMIQEAGSITAYFDVGNIEKNNADNAEAIEGLQNETGEQKNELEKLKDQVAGYEERFTVSVYEGEPCIILHEKTDSDRVQIITNTRRIFARKIETTNTETGEVEVSYVDPTVCDYETLRSKNIEANETVKVGGWVWKRRTNGNLGLMWTEVDS